MQALLAMAVLAALALIGVGAWALAQRRGPPLRPLLMIGAGAVTLLNVWLNAGLADLRS